ncbi:endolytic transglycosylase MltG [Limisalsivibrio acetivorans]|uniref:endolytic transglycosylase MltG n=1 Tax=Limisalsivibrio acetivorans TaxID=1304888 RepID=UPI0003B331B0|nr:endolytic transglycosylase MltG [Limisalsivibrio acetivorans]
MILRIIVLVITLAFAGSFLAGWWITENEKFLKNNNVTIELDIPKNGTFNEVYDRVFKHMETPPFFREYLIYVKKADRRIKYGYYNAEGTSLKELMEAIYKGAQSTMKITFPEGYNIHDMANVIEEKKMAGAEEFLKACLDDDFIKKLTGYDAPTIEGFLYPDTYYFAPYTKPDYIIRTMYANFKDNLPENFGEKVGRYGLSEYEGVILASIIQKETYRIEESKLVASVFYNRLKRGMRLQADPTIIYGKYAEFDGNIRKSDIKDDTNPYNTYQIKGLPPTPISNPSRQALEAAAEPADTRYLYFVATKEGKHVFSKSYREHRRNVYIHQKKR